LDHGCLRSCGCVKSLPEDHASHTASTKSLWEEIDLLAAGVILLEEVIVPQLGLCYTEWRPKEELHPQDASAGDHYNESSTRNST
jgi:hypothetical protein